MTFFPSLFLNIVIFLHLSNQIRFSKMVSKENKAVIEIVLSDSDDGGPRGVEKSETAESAEGEELKVDVESSRSDKEWAAGNGRMGTGEEVKQEPEQERDLEMKLDAAEVDSVGEVVSCNLG